MRTAPKTKIEGSDASTNSQLPKGWVEAKLGAVVESMKNGLYKPASDYAEGGTACLRMYNIEDGKIAWKAIKRMLLTVAEVDEYRLAPGDLLVNRVNSRELVGKTAVFPEGLEPCVYESKNIRVRIIPELVNSDFVNYRLLLSGQSHFNYHSQQVVGMASISQPQIADFPLPLAPRAEQERIVTRVQALLAQLNKARIQIGHVSNILKAFRQAVLAAACSGKLTEAWREAHPCDRSGAELLEPLKQKRAAEDYEIETPTEIPESWIWVRFGLLIGELKNGLSPRPDLEPPGTPILRISSVRTGRVSLDDRRYLRTKKDVTDYRLRDGDLLFTRYNGSLDLLGVCGMVRELQRSVLLYPDKLMRVRFDQSWILPAYAEIFFASPAARERITGNAVSSAGQQGISGATVKAQPFAFPPPEEQAEIIRRVDRLFKLADAIEKRVNAASLRAERLTQAILAKAFRGELVPTEAELARRDGRDYEPASALLQRIKSERAVSDGQSRTKSRLGGRRRAT